jgi:hypothetical protein
VKNLDAPTPTIQVVHLIPVKPTKPRNNVPGRGDYPEIREQATNSASIPKALARAYRANRVADTVLVNLNGREWAYNTKDFETKLSKHISCATLPGVTMEQFLDIFTNP